MAGGDGKWRLLALGAFADEISSFLSPIERHQLTQMHRSIDPLQQPSSVHKKTGDLLLQAQRDLPILSTSLLQMPLLPANSQKSRQRRKRPNALNASQARTIAHDLVLVALGVRPSCLVDCAAMDLATVQALLNAATRDQTWINFGIPRVYAVLLNGNVFFVNASVWLREKRIELASRLRDVAIVNVSPHLPEAQWIDPRLPGDDIAAIQSDLAQICDQLQSLKRAQDQSASRVVVLNKLQSEPIAVAGLLLCYPVIYAIFDPSKLKQPSEPDTWTTQENCLAMTPLHVLSASFAMYVFCRSSHPVFFSFASPFSVSWVWCPLAHPLRLPASLSSASSPSHSTCWSGRSRSRCG